MEQKKREKPDEELIKKLVNSLELSKLGFIKAFNHCISDIENAVDIDTVMEKKKSLLRHIILAMPLGSSSCYFCLDAYQRHPEGADYCYDCKYGEKFGICLRDSDSPWQEIQMALQEVLKAVDLYWD